MNAFRFGWHLGVLEESAQVGELQVDRLREGVEQPPHLRGRMHRYYIDCLHTGRYHIDTHTFRYRIDRTYISIKCPATAFSKREASARRRPWRKGSGGAEAWGGLPLETRPPIRQSPCPHSEPESETDRELTEFRDGPGTHRAARHAAAREHWHPRAADPPPVRRPIFAARKRWAGRTRPSTHALGQPSPAGSWGLRTDAASRGTEAFFRPPTPPGARPDLLFLTPAKNPPSAGPVMRPMGDLRTRNRKTRSPVQEHLLLLRRTRPSVP